MNNQPLDLSNNFDKYNLGCGTLLYQNFLNIGFWESLEKNGIYKDLNGTQNTYMLNYDLRQGIPASDNSLELIYHSHMLEHLSYEDGIIFIRDCYRALKKGGKMRIIVPDLEAWINGYFLNNKFFYGEYRKILNNNIYVTKGSILMGMLHNHDHKCGYDFETLSWLCDYIGFININRTLYCESSIDSIKNQILDIEPNNPLRIKESLCVECEK